MPQFQQRMAEFDEILHKLFTQGKLKSRSHIVNGLKNAAEALKMLFAGTNDGKLMVKV